MKLDPTERNKNKCHPRLQQEAQPVQRCGKEKTKEQNKTKRKRMPIKDEKASPQNDLILFLNQEAESNILSSTAS